MDLVPHVDRRRVGIVEDRDQVAVLAIHSPDRETRLVRELRPGHVDRPLAEIGESLNGDAVQDDLDLLECADLFLGILGRVVMKQPRPLGLLEIDL